VVIVVLVNMNEEAGQWAHHDRDSRPATKGPWRTSGWQHPHGLRCRPLSQPTSVPADASLAGRDHLQREGPPALLAGGPPVVSLLLLVRSLPDDRGRGPVRWPWPAARDRRPIVYATR